MYKKIFLTIIIIGLQAKQINWDTFRSDIQNKVDAKVQANAGLPEIQQCKPLHDAAKQGNVQLTNELIAKGANVNEIGCFWQMTPIQVALFDETEKIPLTTIADAIAQWHVNQDRTALDELSKLSMEFVGNKENAYQIVKALLEHGAKSSIEHTQTYFKRTALHIAALFNHDKSATLLCEYGAKKDVLDIAGYTPLVIACLNGHVEAVRALVKAGVDLTIKIRNTAIAIADDDQPMAIHLSALRGSKEIITILLDAGQDVNSMNAFGQTPLHYAAMNLDEPMIKLLINRGALLDIKDTCGIDPSTGKDFCGYSALGRAVKALRAKNPGITDTEIANNSIIKLLQYKKQ